MNKFLPIVFLSLSLIFSQQIQAQLVINEVDYDQPSNDDAEFIEVKNISTLDVATSAFALIFYNGATSEVYDSIPLPELGMIGAGEYMVLCGNGGNVPNCDTVIDQLANIIQNGSPDALAIVTQSNGMVIDAVSYEGDTDLYIEGSGVPTANADNNDDPKLGISRYPDGTDTDDNSADFSQRCISPGEENIVESTNCDMTTAVHSLKKDGIAVYPNPANETLNIRLETHSNVELQLVDVSGRLIKHMEATPENSQVQISTATLSEGIYILNADINGKVVKQKVSVLH